MVFRHLNKVCMTYYEHLCFSLFLSKEFAIASYKALIHALFPPCYVSSSTDTIKNLSEEMGKVGCKQEHSE